MAGGGILLPCSSKKENIKMGMKNEGKNVQDSICMTEGSFWKETGVLPLGNDLLASATYLCVDVQQ